MSGTLSQGQMAALSNFLTIAQMELTENDQSQTIAYLNQYYSTLASYGSGYAALAQNVVDNTTVFGEVANSLVANAIGAQNWQSIRLKVAVSLASADYNAMVGNGSNGGGGFATAAEIDDFHAVVFTQFGIPITAWGGDAFAVLGLDWSGGALSAFELSSGQSQSSYFTSQTETQVDQAIDNLFNPSTPVWSALLDGGISTFVSSAIRFQQLESAYGQRYGINPLITTEQFGDGATEIQNAQPSGGISALIFDDTANTSFSTGDDTIVAVYADYVTVTNSGTGCTDGINCSGDIVNSSDNIVNIGSFDSLTIYGASDSITSSTNTAIALAGNDNLVNANTNDNLVAVGTNNNIVVTSGTVDVLDASQSVDSSAYISGYNDLVYADAGSSVGLNGGGYGYFTVNAGQNATIAENANTVVSLFGSDVNSYISSGSLVSLEGSGDVVTGQIYGIIQAFTEGIIFNNFVPYANVYLGNYVYAGIEGTEDTIFGGIGDTIATAPYIALTSTASEANFFLGYGGYLTLDEVTGDGVYASGGNQLSYNDTITASSNSSFSVDLTSSFVYASALDNISLMSGSDNDVVYMQPNDIITAAANVTFSLEGNNSVVYLGNGAYAGLVSGTSDNFDGSNATIQAGAGTSFNVNGGADEVNFLGTGGYVGVLQDSSANVVASGDTVDTLSDTSVAITGSNNNLSLGTDSVLNLVSGSNDVITSSEDEINAGANVSYTIQTSNSEFSLASGSSTDLSSGTLNDFNGTNATIEAAGGTSFNVNGSNDQVSFGGSNGYVGVLQGSGITIERKWGYRSNPGQRQCCCLRQR